MKKAKRIFALAGAVILIALYLLTFLFSLMDSDLAHGLFGASFACTFIIPVVSYACILLYRLSHKDDSENKKTTAELFHLSGSVFFFKRQMPYLRKGSPFPASSPRSYSED